MTRRQFLAATAAAAAMPRFARSAPSSTVAISKCPTYGAELLPALDRMFDQIGGLTGLVANKTVAIKLNLTGSPNQRLANAPTELAQWVHPDVIGSVVHLLGRAGARRIRLLESPWDTADTLEQYMLAAKWQPQTILGAAPRVECENTNYLGNAKKYTRFNVPHNGQLFRAYDLNHSYEDCDVFVSIAKLKEHATAGVTLSMKNCFGITPCTIYGDRSAVDEPSLTPKGGRGTTLHNGRRQPSKSAVSEIDPKSPRDPGYRVPRVIADLVAARPIHLAIIDGIETMAGGEGPWVGGCRRVSPGLLVAGKNCVSTDAVATALMGFDPMSLRGAAPFEKCDSHLALAEQLGVGTRDLKQIEVAGVPVEKARFRFRS
jgi:uncharacterized protein (DUF362 family)